MSYEYALSKGAVHVTLDDEGNVEEILLWIPAIGRQLDVTNMRATFPEIADFEAQAREKFQQESPEQDALDRIAEARGDELRNGDV